MKKSKRLAAGITAAAVVVLAVAAYFFFPIKPFSRLSAEDVRQIFVFAAPPGAQAELRNL